MSLTTPGDVVITLARFCRRHPPQRPQPPKAADIGLCNKPHLGAWHRPSQLATALDGHPPTSPGMFNLKAGQAPRAASLGVAVSQALIFIDAALREGFYYASHSPRIGGLNELVSLQYSKPWIMHRLDLRSDSMFSVHYDSRVLLTNDSEWFFGHLRRAVTRK